MSKIRSRTITAHVFRFYIAHVIGLITFSVLKVCETLWADGQIYSGRL